MPLTTRLRPHVLAIREQLSDERAQVRQQHDRGLDAAQVCSRLTKSVDAAVRKILDAAFEDLSEGHPERLTGHVALVAHGGYGRRQLAPYSDVDLMILSDGVDQDMVANFARRLTQDIFDVGLQLGQSVRTPSQAMQLARNDPVICTSLLESRLIAGDNGLYDRYYQSLGKMIQRRGVSLCRAFIAARRQERHQFGETVYLLEPNVKRSRGGLRDLHLLRWLWFIKCGVNDIDRLHGMGIVSKFDYRRLVSSQDFLLRVRNELHFHAGSSCDALSRAEQLRLAEKLEFRGRQGLRPVEQFMRDYFHHANHIWQLAHRLSELTIPRSAVARVLEPMVGRMVERDFRIGIHEISSTSTGDAKLRQGVDEVLRLVDLARMYDKRISQETWYHVYRTAPSYSAELTPAAIHRFTDILTQPLQLGELLRRLHELGVLEKIIPEFSHARCLLQFNQYHKYTVDEHCIRAVEEVASFSARRDALGEAYRHLGDKRTLHLALLLHDLGKGYEEDHSEVGLRIAQKTAERLQLAPDVADTLVFLVHQHLRMSHLAFRRDTSSGDVVRRFAREIGSPNRLTMLYLLSCADLAAVGPGVLNGWKVEVLTDLHQRSLSALAPEGIPSESDRRESARQAVSALLLAHEREDSWFTRQFEALPESFVTMRKPAQIVETLRRLRDLAPNAGRAWGAYLSETDTVEFTAGIDQGSGRGIFSAMAGALSNKGIEILAADTATLADNLLLLRYVVRDSVHSGQPPLERLDEVSAALVEAIDHDQPPVFRRMWGSDRSEANAALSNLPNEVRIDNELSEECTIVEVFTIDRRGILYELARAQHDLGLIIRFAKIGTYLDQVVDVFYVTERDGQKPSPDRQNEIRGRLTEVIERRG
jgi:[protein-PII] uridylyltransferase